MRRTLKIASVAVAAFLALTAVALVYAYSASTSNAIQTRTWNMGNYFDLNNATGPCYREGMGRMRGNYFGNGQLSQNTTLSTVQGTVVTEVNGMLVLDTGSGEVRIMLPREWTVGSDVVSRSTLFNGTFASPGQTVTVKVLESDVFSNASFSINTMLAYEAINASSVHAYAVLPFNIQPTG